MIDKVWLSNWVQAQHLESENIKSYYEAFNFHPARALVLKDFLRGEVAEHLAHFLINEAQYRTIFGIYSDTAERDPIVNVTEDTWLQTEEENRFYKFKQFIGLSDKFLLTTNTVTFLKFRAAYASAKFRALIEQISRLALGPVPTINMYSYGSGDYLRTHCDVGKNKRLAYVIYLTPNWTPGLGGALHLINPNADLTKVEAEFNSIVLFDVKAKTRHFVAPIEGSAAPRITISGWWHEPDLSQSAASRTS
jgi:2OG-Fe(II) oxygenase superfamily